MNDTRNVIDEFRGIPTEEIKKTLRRTSFPFHVAIENFQHDMNIGSIVRSANAFNATAVHIIGKKHWNRRGAMMTEQYLDVFHYKSITEFQYWLQSVQLPIIGIDNIPGSTPLSEYTLPKEAVFVFGQEGPGISEEMQTICDVIVKIEQFGSTRSINVGAAASIIMYQWHYKNNLKSYE